jgi:hypothetical protein
MTPQLRERLVNSLVKELRSSTTRGSDADWHIGFKGVETPVEESEYDPKTGKVVNNTAIGDHATFMQQWDNEGGWFIEEDDIPDRDSGTYSYKLHDLI